ncbi:MAG: transcription termination factor Rho [Otoolea sp.]|nr:transcription termination factor Rho [Clostridium sp.]
MREKLQTLPLSQLRELAKAQGVKSVTTLKKAELIDKLCEIAQSGDTGKEEALQEQEVRPSEAPREQTGRQAEAPKEPKRQYQTREYQPRNYQPRNYQPRTEAASGENVSVNDTPTKPEAQARMEEARNDFQELDSGIEANGILEVMPDGFGFIRCENFLPGENDVYVAPSQIRRFNLKTGDIVKGSRRIKSATEKFAALLYINTVNGYPTSVVERRPNFENLTPIFPNRRLHLEMPGGKSSTAMRVMDLLSPIGKGQRGMIVSPPKAGKTTLLKQVAKAVTTNHPEMHLIILLIDERPEEVTDIKEAIVGPNVEVIYSTFDELPERHKRVSEMVIERAKRLVEHGRDVMILLDSMTRLARAYNLVVPPSGRTLSGGLDPAALHMPKRFFGAARNMREGGSLTILATALIETGSRMDDVIYEEFKGTGNMELVLDRKLSEKRIFPALDILRSGTRRDDLLLTPEESEVVDIIHKATNTQKPEDSVERILELFSKTRSNAEFVEITRKKRYI